MKLYNALSFFLLSLAAAAATVIPLQTISQPPSCNPGQSDTLLRLKNSFSITGPSPSNEFDFCANISYPKTASWREDGDCCSWEGVQCDYLTGDVVGLDLTCARLHGTIDSHSSLFSLRHLRSLSLAGIDLLGSSIPPEISVFSRLTYLNLSFSSISGNVPTEISQLSKLVSLDLSGNGLEVQNPTMRMLVKNLTQLEELHLTSVDMSAVIPTSLMNFSSSLISLHLLNCSLGGKFPDYIFKLPNIQKLGLAGNTLLNGTLQGFNWSSNLAYLSLGGCSFTGEVPHSIGNLPRLTYLDISGNNFTGRVDLFAFSTLKNLRFLGLSGLIVSEANPKFPKLEGLGIFEGHLNNFPCLLFSMPELRELDIIRSILGDFPGQCDDNDLSLPQLQALQMIICNLTKFPSFLSRSKKLRFLDLRGNMIEEIPSWFWGIGINTLEILHLADNLLKGGLQLPWKKLSLLNLRNNSFEGALPIPLAQFIRIFDVMQNRFNGSISPSICQLTSLQNLALRQNNLTGVVPLCLGNLTDLQFLDLSSNSLTGPLPLPSYATNYYSVSKNNFSGEISLLICNATNLRLFDLSSNGITGTLPQCLKNITMSLVYLNVRMNKFHGSIPEIFPKGCDLTSIDFSRNQFRGSLPRSLSNCQRLEVLDVGRNKIVDSFPRWLGDLPLKILSLRSNKLHGPVSISKGTHPLSTIRVLDLSNNSFEDNLPDNLIEEMFDMRLGDSLSRDNRYKVGGNAGYMVSSFSSILTARVYEPFFSVMIDLKGVETEMEKINFQFATLDLSCNHFGGEIPRNIGLLKSLKGLNFSHNCFTGTIPPSVGNLTNLEALDLSSNYLVGGIPRELAQLTSLGALDLSRNNLTGAIPLGGHFNTFPNSSFDGNPGLCGIPLTRACSQGHAESQPPQNRGDNGEEVAGGWLEWKFVAMGFGSGLGIGISLGYMALETGKPLWLARMVIRLETSCRKGSKRKSPRRNGRR